MTSTGTVRGVSVEMRVLSWNLYGLRDDQAALHRVVREVDPDVMLVQEAPKFARWRAKVAKLARECGLLYVTGGGTTGGTALLVNLRVDVERSAQLALSRYRLGWPDRGVAAAVVRKRGARLAVASLHLPLPETERLDHVTRALAVLRASGIAPALAGGDLNERPGRTAWSFLETAQRADVPRRTAREAHRRRDRHRRRRARRLPGGGRCRRRARQRPPPGPGHRATPRGLSQPSRPGRLPSR